MASQAEQFVHLHVHSQYSLLDGACRTADLPRRAAELGQQSVAITDHGCLFGLIDFYEQCQQHNVKPIIGIEAYMAPGDRRDRTYSGVKDGGYHLLLLARNRTGYQNLLKLSSIAYMEGFYFKPRIDKEVLRAHSDGLICTSACLGGEIPTALTSDDRKRAKQLAETYLEIFGPDRFFVELQSHIREQNAINPELVDLSERMGVGTVATNDVHFLLPDDHEPHDALCCIATGKLVSDESRLTYPKQLYLKGSEEMRQAAPDLGQPWQAACDNTLRIAEDCDVELDFSENHAPVVRIEHKPQAAAESAPAGGAAGQPEITNHPSSIANDVPYGSTEWFNRYCAQYELLPFDAEKDNESEADLERQCDEALRDLVEAGAVWRYGPDGITDEVRARIDRELKILSDKRISAYFLIVWDFVNYARSRGIPCNARGSGVATMVGYCLGLSNACPVTYGLLFERFTDPNRAEYPDIDIDLCQDGRAEVIDYVRRKYGHVAQIITFGTLKARAVLRDIGRVLGVELAEVDRITKLVPEELGITLDDALEAEPDLKAEYEKNENAKRMIDMGRRLEGLTRHAGVHAAGVVVATQPLENIVPLYRDPRNSKAKGDGEEAQDLITQWDGPTCEKVGLLKMDFLGLQTLSIIERAKNLIRGSLDRETQVKTIAGAYGHEPCPDTPREFGLHRHDHLSDHARSDHAGDALPDELRHLDPLDLERLSFVDQNVLDLFRRGETAGVFQFESGGMRNLLTGMKPDRINDLIAANALFRPGPMDLIPHYNDRKHGREQVPTTHPIVDKHTKETYGVMVYQEQVMQIIHELGGIPLREAYKIIKAISKKKEKVIASARDQFIEGAQQNGQTKEEAERLFELILKFAGYGFNKSHSTGYAIVAYQTAFLKTYFPLHYMAALLSYEATNTDKVTEYIEACRRTRLPNGSVGIEVKPPDINRSGRDFTVVYDENEPRDPNRGHIRFGLGAVKGVGHKAVDQIIAAREAGGPFTSLFDFAERVPHGLVNKTVIEALIRCGAFDSVHGSEKRAAMIEAVESALSRGAQEAELRSSDDFLFGAVEDDAEQAGPERSEGPGSADPDLPDVEPWDAATMLQQEKAVLGFFVSSHPLDRWQRTIDRFASATCAEAQKLKADTELTVAGMIGRVRITQTRKKQEKMAILTVEDTTGQLDAVAFPRTYAEHAHLLEHERIVLLTGTLDRRREEPNLIVDRVVPIEEAPRHMSRALKITLTDPDPYGTQAGPEFAQANGGPGQSSINNQKSEITHPLSDRELTSLRTMLRQSPGEVPVYFEVRSNGTTAILQARHRVQPDAELPARIKTVLNGSATCELIGPRNVLEANPHAALSDNDPTVTNRLQPDTTADNGACESIDRY